MNVGQPWSEAVITGVAEVLGDAGEGLTHSEISQLFATLRIEDQAPEASKRLRLREALLARQFEDRSPKRLITFVTRVMEPVRYRDAPARFELLRGRLDEVLAHIGLRVTDNGNLARGTRVSTLREAAQHANSLRAELRRRNTHREVLRYCTDEILMKNAFHATLEATKSIADRLRSMTGEHGDGASLVDATLALGKVGKPRVAINTLTTVTERDEQKGFVNIVKGVFSMYRNPTAHDPRISRKVSDDDLLETLTAVSMIHRRLDTATVNP